ncbi:MAG TPA: hypothetical protein VN085_12195 [Vicinamibacterales bacterium]|nr:hypothetical protein [Vicinamibacterales bacterium]
MGLFTPAVPRDVYDREKDRADKAEARVDYLIKQLVGLRKKGYDAQPEPRQGRVTPPGPSPEETALARMEAQLVEHLAKDIEQMPGVSPEAAKREADRLRKEALGTGTVAL